MRTGAEIRWRSKAVGITRRRPVIGTCLDSVDFLISGSLGSSADSWKSNLVLCWRNAGGFVVMKRSAISKNMKIYCSWVSLFKNWNREGINMVSTNVGYSNYLGLPPLRQFFAWDIRGRSIDTMVPFPGPFWRCLERIENIHQPTSSGRCLKC